MYTLGAFLLLAALLGAVTAVIDSVLTTVNVKSAIAKIPVIGAHWGLGISILVMWLLHANLPEGGYLPSAPWGIYTTADWINIVVNGAIVYAAIPVLEAVVNMVNKGFRA